MLEQARQSLSGGDGRKALDLLRQARHADEHREGMPLLAFCACTLRARQLAAKGMEKEAAAMRSRAAQHRTAISARTLPEDDLVLYLHHLDGAEALGAYADRLDAGPSVPRAERVLADWLVTLGGWEDLEALDPDHPLRQDAGPVRRSLEAMDAGDWARAAGLLQGVSRRSPFAPWRLFCKAMVCFGAGDDEGLRRAIDRIPEDFALSRTVAEWKRLCAGEGGGGPVEARGGPIEVRRALGMDGAMVATLAAEFNRALHGGKVRDVERTLTDLADALYPDAPVHARIDLLQIAGLAVLRDKLSVKALMGMVRRLLPADRVSGVSARIALLLQRASPDLWDPTPAGICLDRLPVELPRAPDQALARGRVFESLARTGHKAVNPEFLPPGKMQAVAALLGGRVEDPGLIFAELMMASLAADPGNREGYLFLLDLLRGRTADKSRLRGLLHEMAARFPDDPAPWLELATLHYSRNAYRRAEDALAEARRRAPHDERILDMQAIGLLKSADQSRKNGRLALAARDLERADALGRSLIEPVSSVKGLLLEMVAGGRNAAEGVARRLEPLGAGRQLRTLALLVRDLEDNAHVRNVTPEMREDLEELLARKAPLAGALDPDEVVALLAPLPADFRILYRDLRVAPVLGALWPTLMQRLEGERLIAVFDLLMDCGGRGPVRAEIDRRLRGVAKTRRDPLLLFYLAVIRYLEGQDRDSRRLAEVLKRADPSTRERLREAAGRLARHAHGLLRQALQEFDFDLLDMPPLPPIFGDGPSSLDEFLPLLFGDEGPSLDDLLGGPARSPAGKRRDETSIEGLQDALAGGGADILPDGSPQGSLFDDEQIMEDLRQLERHLDDSGVRGAPSPVLKDFVGEVRSEPGPRRRLERLARECETAGLRDALSREAGALLFPRRQGREGRGRKRRR